MAFSADWTDECQVKALTEEEIRADERRRCRVICMERAIAWRTGAMGVAPNPDSRAYEAEGSRNTKANHTGSVNP